jgi:hypothetical protein
MSVPTFKVRYFPGIYLDGLNKRTQNVSRNIRSPSRDLNPETPVYEARVLLSTTQNSLSEFYCDIEWKPKRDFRFFVKYKRTGVSQFIF